MLNHISNRPPDMIRTVMPVLKENFRIRKTDGYYCGTRDACYVSIRWQYTTTLRPLAENRIVNSEGVCECIRFFRGRAISRENRGGDFDRRGDSIKDRTDYFSRTRFHVVRYSWVSRTDINRRDYGLYLSTIYYIIYSLALLGDDPLTQYVNVCAIDSIVCK